MLLRFCYPRMIFRTGTSSSFLYRQFLRRNLPKSLFLFQMHIEEGAIVEPHYRINYSLYCYQVDTVSRCILDKREM